MKKPLLIILTALFALNAFAQSDACKDIKKTVKELQGVTEYNSPIKVNSRSNVAVSRSFLKRDSMTVKSDRLIFTCNSFGPDYTIHGIYVKFKDGTIVRDENAKVECSYNTAGYYFYVGLLDLTPDLIDKISKSPIEKFSLGSHDAYIVDSKLANKIIGYSSCVFSITN
jgi:hypothetical protein